MERYSGSTVYVLASAVCGLLTDTVMGEKCRKAVIREKRTQANFSYPGQILPRRRSWEWTDFECDNGCCGEAANQYCCPEEDDEEEGGSSTVLVTGLSVSIVILMLTVVLAVVFCMCFRARKKPSQHTRRRPTVASTVSSATLPPSYELSTTVPEMSAGNAVSLASEVGSPPPSYEEVMAADMPSAPPLPAYHSAATSAQLHASPNLTHAPRQGKDNHAFFRVDIN